MQKLLNAYRAAPTLANAHKVSLYAAKHPMTACFMSADDAATLQAARVQLAGGK